jgi:hypothetical protein
VAGAGGVSGRAVLAGVMLVAGNRFGKAVVRVMAVDEDGQVHFTCRVPAGWPDTTANRA